MFEVFRILRFAQNDIRLVLGETFVSSLASFGIADYVSDVVSDLASDLVSSYHHKFNGGLDARFLD